MGAALELCDLIAKSCDHVCLGTHSSYDSHMVEVTYDLVPSDNRETCRLYRDRYREKLKSLSPSSSLLHELEVGMQYTVT